MIKQRVEYSSIVISDSQICNVEEDTSNKFTETLSSLTIKYQPIKSLKTTLNQTLIIIKKLLFSNWWDLVKYFLAKASRMVQ